MSSLAEQAKLDLPLVEEIAAGIFMGEFTTQWVRAAQATCAAPTGPKRARRFLGWSSGSHWLLAPNDRPPGVLEFARVPARCGLPSRIGAACLSEAGEGGGPGV